MERGRKHPWSYVALAAFVIAAAGLRYVGFASSPTAPTSVVAPAAPSAPPSSPAASGPAAAATPAPLQPGETVLCGYGRIRIDDMGAIRDRERQAADKAFDGLKSKLAASTQARDVALGFYLQGSTDALVALATGRNDPQVYALAFMACGYNTAPAGNCALLSAQQWSSIEPDNGIPWLLIASAAAGDKEARNQAVLRAAAATYFDARAPDVLALLQRPEVRELRPQAHAALQDQLLAMQTTAPTLIYTPFLQYCSDASVDPAARTGACRSLSDRLLRDRSLFAYATGIRLAELAGAPAEEVRALRQKKADLQNALNDAVTRTQARPAADCEEIAAFDRWAAEYGRLGETGIAAKLLEEARARAR